MTIFCACALCCSAAADEPASGTAKPGFFAASAEEAALAAPPTAGSFTTVANYTALLSGYSWWWDNLTGRPAVLTYSFETQADAVEYGSEPSFLASMRPFSAAHQDLARQAFSIWSSQTGLQFIEAAPGYGDFRLYAHNFMLLPGYEDAAGFASYPGSSDTSEPYVSDNYGDVYIDTDFLSYASDVSVVGVLLHEIGHGIGLKHPFEDTPRLRSDLDNKSQTVMSYTGSYPSFALGPLDIQAGQYLYGLPSSDGSHIASYAWNTTTQTMTQTGFATADRIRGNAGFNVINAGGGNDVVLGNSRSDTLRGEAGDDVLHGEGGDDALYGGDGIDTLWGVAGNDGLFGEAGNDVLWGGDGNDTVNGDAGNDSVLGNGGNDSLSGGDGLDTLWGYDGNDLLIGDAGNDYLGGLAGNDSQTGGAGDDTHAGGEGTDIVQFSGTRATYQIIKSGNSYQIRDKTANRDGTDWISDVEIARFSNMSVDFTVAAAAAGVPAGQLKTLLELYVGFFNRIPEASGVKYWIDQLKTTGDLAGIANQFYAAGVQFSDLTGYSASMTTAQFITKVYANVLGRSGATAPDTSEISFWASYLGVSGNTQGSMVLKMISDTHANFTNHPVFGFVASLLTNKSTVANVFAIQQGLSYNTDAENITRGMEMAAAVTPTSTAAAIALIGVSDAFI